MKIQKLLAPLEQAIKSNLGEATTKILSTLTPREERVLRMRFGVGMNTDHTLRRSWFAIFCNKRKNKTNRS